MGTFWIRIICPQLFWPENLTAKNYLVWQLPWLYMIFGFSTHATARPLLLSPLVDLFDLQICPDRIYRCQILESHKSSQIWHYFLTVHRITGLFGHFSQLVCYSSGQYILTIRFDEVWKFPISISCIYISN